MEYRKFILSLVAAGICLVCPAVPASPVAEDAASETSEETSESSDTGFERYRSIMERQPFGPPPPGFDPTAPVGKGGAGGAAGAGGKTAEQISAEEQKMMSSVRVSVLNVTPAGAVMVGFTDSTTQPPVNYYMKVGDTSTDAAKWTVKSAEPAAGTVTLEKDGLEVSLAVGGETKKGAPAGKSATPLAGQRHGRTPLLPSSANVAQAGAKGNDAGGGLGALGRLRQRRLMKQAQEDADRQAADKARADAEAREKAERELEREQQAAEREQQRQALLQIQEELRRQRELKQKNAEEAETVQEEEQ